MSGPRRTHNTLGHRKLAELVAQHGSLLEVARQARVAYSRLLRIVDGVEPRASDALALALLGIEIPDWGNSTLKKATAEEDVAPIDATASEGTGARVEAA